MIPKNGKTTASEEIFARLENPATDFPFYKGLPVFIPARKWLLIIGSVIVAFLLLELPINRPSELFAQFIPAILMPILPIIALAYVAKENWKVIFGRVRGHEIKLMLYFALLNIFISMIIGTVVLAIFGATPNAATAQLSGLDVKERALFFLKTIPQLFGEEVITILPFLALLQLFSGTLRVKRKGAIIFAWVITSILFGLLHLPTYDWNWIQCVIVIGSARMVLTLPWIMTKNIWVSTGAHIINDWIILIVTLLGAGLISNP
jgi:membrane protease YdiL (CAAX protease family)